MKTLIYACFLSFCVCNLGSNLRNRYKNGYHDSDNWDWRDHNPISPVDNELNTNCSSSYIFAALGAIEGVRTIKGDNLKKISSQEYIDCSGSNTCKLGSIIDVLNYYSDREVCEDSKYSYSGVKEECQNSRCNSNIKIKQLSYKKLRGEFMIKTMHIVPVPTKIYIDSLRNYTGGIYQDYDACNHEPNHWVLVVGYGIEGGVEYWVIKNDFGEEWGEKGYLRLERGKGMCGIGTESYAVYYSEWKTWIIVIAVVAVALVLICCICCCCCCCAAATGSTAAMTHCCCFCCYSGKESCIHPERIEVKRSKQYSYNNPLYDETGVDAEVVKPVQGQKVITQPVEAQYIPQPVQQQYYQPQPVEQQYYQQPLQPQQYNQPIQPNHINVQQQYIQQPSPTNNYTPALQYDKLNNSNPHNEEFYSQHSEDKEPILLPGSNPYKK